MALALLTSVLTSCHETESYSDLLRDEEKACNWFLAQQRVATDIPADSVFEAGPNAPYYRMDPDGYIYMQVISAGNLDAERPKDGDRVYFRFTRWNIKTEWQGGVASAEGNADNMNSSVGNTSFILGNSTLTSSTQYGTGIQMPLRYLGYDSEVNLLLKSYYGFSVDQNHGLAYKVNIRYFKAEY